jgi:predicted PurR-regulated permease PerM
MTDSQKWLVFIFLAVMGGLIYILAPILMPFVFAAILAYLGDPLADRLEILRVKNFQLGRTGSVVVVFTVMLLIISALLIIIVPKIEFQISYFLSQFPAYVKWVNTAIIPWIEHVTGVDIGLVQGHEITEIIKGHWQKAGKSALKLMGSVSRSSAIIAEFTMNLVLIPVITFYLLRDWDILVEKVYHLFPKRAAPTVGKLASEANIVLGAFMRGQFYVMFALGVIYSVGLWFIDLNLALLIGMIAGLVSFVPYLGSIVGITIACIAALLQFQDPVYLLPVSLVFVVGQSLEGMLLTPWLVGDKIGLHPVAVMFSVLAGGQLFGFVGVLLALPVASVIMVIMRHIHDIYRDSDFYQAENDG